MCIKCNAEDNIVHMFADSKKVKQFWISFKEYVAECLGKPFTITTAEVIFGKFGIPNTAANFCILHTKWYIHLNKEQPVISFHYFKQYLKNVLVIEKQIYVNRRKIEAFAKLFSPFIMTLH